MFIIYIHSAFEGNLSISRIKYRVVNYYILCSFQITDECRGRRGRYRMVVGFTTTYAISADHH